MHGVHRTDISDLVITTGTYCDSAKTILVSHQYTFSAEQGCIAAAVQKLGNAYG